MKITSRYYVLKDVTFVPSNEEVLGGSSAYLKSLV